MNLNNQNLNTNHNSNQHKHLNNNLRIILDSAMLAFILWLFINPVLTILSPKLTSTIQSAMISHREIGFIFLIFLIIYYPLHIIASNGFTFSALKKIIFPIQGIIFIVIVYIIFLPLWKISRYNSLLVFGAVFILFEWRHKQRSVFKRLFDFGITFIIILYTLNANIDSFPRILFQSITVYSFGTIIWLTLHLFRKKDFDFEPWGNIGVYIAMPMFTFSLMMFGGTNSGKYSRTLPGPDFFHHLTSLIFVSIILLHTLAITKKQKAENKNQKIISLPIIFLAILFFISWEIKNIYTYQKFAAPIVDAKNIKTIEVSKYSYLKAYKFKDKNMWFAADTQSCGLARCHLEVTKQHNLSAHGRAYENEVFKWELGIFIKEKGRAAADYCIACHAPFAVINYPGDSPQGKKINPLTTKKLSFTTGITCVVCHRAVPEKNPDKIGNASLLIKPLYLDYEKYLGEETNTKKGKNLQLLLTNASINLHKKKYHLNKKEADYICGACHLVRLPSNFSVDGKERKPADHYTSFIESPYAQTGFSCADCHQQRFETFVEGYYTINHNYLGSGSSLPYNNKKKDTKLRNISLWFLAGLGDITLNATQEEDLPPCIDDLNTYNNNYKVPLQRSSKNSFKSSNGSLIFRNLLKTKLTVVSNSNNFIKLKVDTTNYCIGHSFPSGGGIKSYLEVKVFDKDKKLIGKFGGLATDGKPYSNPTNLGSKVINKEGKLIQDRRFWAAYKVIYKNYINPGETKTNNIILKIVSGSNPFIVEAKWFYLRPEFFRNKERGIKKYIPSVVIGKTTIKF